MLDRGPVSLIVSNYAVYCIRYGTLSSHLIGKISSCSVGIHGLTWTMSKALGYAKALGYEKEVDCMAT